MVLTLYGPDGAPIGAPRLALDDDELVLEKGEEVVRQSPEQLLMAMARAERDGMNHKQIIAEYGLMGEAASPFVLNRALRVGRGLLAAAILEGREPAVTGG